MFAFKKKRPNLVKEKAHLAAEMARALVQNTSPAAPPPPPPHTDNLLLEELRARLQQRDQTIHYLSKEIELLRVGINVITEDLSVKEEQFSYLFSSLRDSATFVQQNNAQAELEFDARVLKLANMEKQVHEQQQKVHEQQQKVHEQHLRQGNNKDEDYSNETKSPVSSSSLSPLSPTPPPSFSFHRLPFECREIIVSHLKFIDQGRCCCVNKKWNACHTESQVWFHGYRLYWDPECRQSLVVRSLNIPPSHRSGPMHSWKHKCQQRARVESKWNSSRPLVTTLVGHQGTVTCLGMVGESGRMISGSDDGSLRLWATEDSNVAEVSTNEVDKDLCQQHHRQTRPSRRLRAFQGHGGPVWCHTIKENTLYSGSYDKCIKMWDIQSGECLRTLRGHTGWVSCIDMMAASIGCGDDYGNGNGSSSSSSSSSSSNIPGGSGVLVSGSWDATIKIWRPGTGELLKTIARGNADAVYCLKCDRRSSGQIAVGGRCPDVHMMDVTSTATRVFKGHCKPVNALQIDTASQYGRVVTGSSDTTMKVWDDRNGRKGSGQCVGTLKHGGAVMAVAQDEYKLVSGCYDKGIRIFDLRRLNGRIGGVGGGAGGGGNKSCCVRRLEAHSGAIFSLVVNHNRIISGSADHTIKTFQFT